MMNKSKVNHDPYCWRCSKSDNEMDLSCTNCIRSFHSRCLTDEEFENVESCDGMCSVCFAIAEAKGTNTATELQTLSIVIKRMLDNNTYSAMKGQTKDGIYLKTPRCDSIVNPVTLTSINENIGTYNSFVQFLADVEWIIHNCAIMFKDNHDKTKTARALLEEINDEIESVKKCAECYRNVNSQPQNWFTMACSEPHLLVWAKMKGFNYWPAKLMSIDGQLINVRFFGDHTHADVPATNCFLFSTQNPDKRRSSTANYLAALKEAHIYIDNVRNRFGAFELTKSKIRFNPAMYDKYVRDMIPGRSGVNTSVDSSDENDDQEENDDMSEDMGGDDFSHCSEESSLSRQLDATKSLKVCLNRIDEKSKSQDRGVKRQQMESIIIDEPVKKLAKTSDTVDGNVTVDLRIERDSGFESSVAVDDDIKMVSPRTSHPIASALPENIEKPVEGDANEKSQENQEKSLQNDEECIIETGPFEYTHVINSDQIDNPDTNNQTQSAEKESTTTTQLIEQQNGDMENGAKDKNVDVENGHMTNGNTENGDTTVNKSSMDEFVFVPHVMPDISNELNRVSGDFTTTVRMVLEKCVQHELDERNEAVKQNCELKKTIADLKIKLNAKQQEYETLLADIEKLKTEKAELEEKTAPGACNECGKILDVVSFCGAKCINQHCKSMMEGKMAKNNAEGKTA